jgi:hypothetical protein
MEAMRELDIRISLGDDLIRSASSMCISNRVGRGCERTRDKKSLFLMTSRKA